MHGGDEPIAVVPDIKDNKTVNIVCIGETSS